jgi:hypothetical protein
MKVAILGIFIALIALSGICMAAPATDSTVVTGVFACVPTFDVSPDSIDLPVAGPGQTVQAGPVVATVSQVCGSAATWTITAETSDHTGKMNSASGSPAAGFEVYSTTSSSWRNMLDPIPITINTGGPTASQSTNVWFRQAFAASDNPDTYTITLNLICTGAGF